MNNKDLAEYPLFRTGWIGVMIIALAVGSKRIGEQGINWENGFVAISGLIGILIMTRWMNYKMEYDTNE